jgi:DNA topoisomerase I
MNDGNGLSFGNDQQPGFRRLGSANRFRYVDVAGKTVGANHLKRIRALVIPPAWTSVWISADPTSHLQATGRDAKGRKQYRYHENFRAHAEADKFDELLEWAEKLPSLRRQVNRDLGRRQHDLRNVSALAVRLLDETSIRIGNEQYARENESYGLTTLRTFHAKLLGSTIQLQFVGKSGQLQKVAYTDRRVARIVRSIVDLPGEQLFHYETTDGVHTIHSADINRYINESVGGKHTAKTFRTWNATVCATRELATAEPPSSRAEERRTIAEAMRKTAGLLGNTPAVARSSYVHPGVIDAYTTGELPTLWDRPTRSRSVMLTVEELKTKAVLTSLGSS